MNETAFFTPTMAKVYADQGHFEKAARIYRHLLNVEPGRQEFKSALLAVERNLEAQVKTRQELSSLFAKWIELLLRFRNLQKLTKLRNSSFNPIRKRV